MGRFAAFFVLALSFGSAVADEYKVSNVRPSRLLAMLAGIEPKKGINLYEITGVEGQMIPLGLHVKADDEKSVLVAEGAAKDKENFGQLVRTLDVKPIDLEANIELSVPLEKYKSSTQTKIRNNSVWKVSDESAYMSLAIRPRLNEDGTITVNVIVGDDKEQRQMTFRVKSNEPVEITLDGVAGVRLRKLEAPNAKDPNMPSMKLVFKVAG